METSSWTASREAASQDVAHSVKLIKTKRFGDARGWFSETYSVATLQGLGVDLTFVQDNQSWSAAAGTVRGIHFQKPPRAQAKLVRCVAGSVMDFAVDLRKESPTYGRYVQALLSRDNGDQLLIPVGFGHAFVTLEPDSEVAYKVSDVYAPECEGGVIWNDPDIAIGWPLPETGAVLSEKDRILPALTDFDSPFTYDGIPLTSL